MSFFISQASPQAFFLKKRKNKILTYYADNWEMGRGT